jgi:putative mRNA 3-end processing factor
MPFTVPPESWLKVTPAGLYCEPGGFHVDPAQPVGRAVITHGHADHARPGHDRVLATPPTLAIMRQRYGEDIGAAQPLAYGEALAIGGVGLRLVPAGHILGSAQVVLEHAGSRVVVSGDYKRRPDPTCPPFEPVACDVFISEATFGLPVFRHPPDIEEIARLLDSQRLFPESAQLVGVYALGKAQRVILLLRAAGYDAPIYLHGALQALCELYRAHGAPLGELRLATGLPKAALAGQIVLAPPAALADRWTRRLPDPVPAMASGWMRVRARARQRHVELPLVISDHADWPELTRTFAEVGAQEIWITHGQEEALVYHCQKQGQRARALALVGRGDEAAEEAA